MPRIPRPASATTTSSACGSPSEDDKQALVHDEGSPWFTTLALRWPSVGLVRESRLGELSREELAEVIEDAWLARASKRRAAQWLADHPNE